MRNHAPSAAVATSRPRGTAVAALLLLLLASCSSTSAKRAGRRIGQDAYVVATSPLQVPWMSVRDAWGLYREPGTSALLFPITFPLFLVEHGLFTVAHAIDLAVFPVHFFRDAGPLDVYETDTFPMEITPETHEAFQIGSGATLFVL